MKFKDFIELHRGYDLPEQNRIQGKYPIFSSTTIVGMHNDYKVKAPGVVTGRSGSLGEVQYAKQNFWPLNTTLFVSDFKGNLPRYVYYFLKTLNLSRFNSGASVPTLNRNDLDNLDIDVHSFPEQQKIASVLCAYDDLIEINERRIKVSEEMAKLIHKEWFVKFRFPGHEKIKMVESQLGLIPEGWEVKKLGDIIELAYGKGLKEENRIPGNFPVYGSSGIVGTHIAKLVDGPGIIVGRKGNVGSIIWSYSDFYPIDTVFYVKPKSEIKGMYFLFHALIFQDFKNIQGDAAVPGLNRNLAYLNDFLVPNIDVIEQYEKAVIPIFQFIEVIEKTNHTLRQTRDLLLPKLISGEIDVSKLDVKSKEGM